MMKALATYGSIQATEKEVSQVISEATRGGDHKVAYDVFKRVMTTH